MDQLADVMGATSSVPFRTHGGDRHRQEPRHHSQELRNPRILTHHRMQVDPIQDKIEGFLRANAVDDVAAESLRRCEPGVAEAVMSKGISTARNPSSALLARIRDERKGVAGGYHSPSEPGHEYHGGRGRGRSFTDEVH